MAPAGNRQPAQRVEQVVVKQTRGPLPPPETLREYDLLIPGSAERIISMWERQQNHRHDLEHTGLTEGIKYAKRGQWMAYTITMGAFLIGTYLAINGQATVAGILFGTVIIGVVGSFLASKSVRAAEDKAKDQ